MKKTLFSLVVALAVLNGSQLGATTYSDSAGDVFTGAGGGILDIVSAEITNTASDIYFTVSVNTASIISPDWGKYMVGINSVAGGDTTGNGWGRPINMPAGMDYWLGSWVDFGGNAEVRSYSGVWSAPAAPTSFSISGNSVTFSTSLASLGLSPGNTFSFDIYTSGGGGGDSAVDSLANPGLSITDWPGPYATPVVNSYTVTPVPEPATYAFAGMGGLIFLQRLFRRRA